ncbi:GFA family protein [Roseibium algae]|uniref:GFA family protein n=1 Tax=Roseibium algae TaxID=3123038 RepID=A0ABU8TS68_9HYPH
MWRHEKQPGYTLNQPRTCPENCDHFSHAPTDKLYLSNKDGLEWYESSSFARRGFCKFCGSSLFYQMKGDENTAIAAGILNGPTGLKIGKHIFVKDKGDYYEINEDEPQIARY